MLARSKASSGKEEPVLFNPETHSKKSWARSFGVALCQKGVVFITILACVVSDEMYSAILES
ncbi:MAG: hypothetical protein M5U34_33710 [Chloroflexi bacterium]|nr:hypothetical protein [Chloroflexota bacterium]